VLSGCNQVPAARVPAGQRLQSGTGGNGLRFPDSGFPAAVLRPCAKCYSLHAAA
jgi:hypothetical protein